MTPALQYKHVIIRTKKCLLKGEEINNTIFHDKGDRLPGPLIHHLLELHTRIVHLG